MPVNVRSRTLWIGIATWLAISLALILPVAANSPWIASSSMPFTPAYHTLITANSRLYVIGGDIGSGPLDKVLVAPVKADGAVGWWSESPHELPQRLAEHASVMVDRWIYLVGGTNGQAALRTAFSATISGTGEIGPWQSTPVLLPGGTRAHSGVSVERTIYAIGGIDEGGKTKDEVFRATVDTSGQLGNWERTGTLPQPIAHAAATSWAKRVYVVGGENERGPVANVYAGFVGPGGELTWRSQRPLPRPLSRGTVFSNGAVLFYIGGYDGAASAPDAYAAPINADGTISEWIGWLPLPRGIAGLSGAYFNGRVYLAGGFDGARFIDSVWFLPLDPPLPATPTATPIPAPVVQSLSEILPIAVAGSVIVALLSLSVVTIVLIAEKHASTPGSGNGK